MSKFLSTNSIVFRSLVYHLNWWPRCCHNSKVISALVKICTIASQVAVRLGPTYSFDLSSVWFKTKILLNVEVAVININVNVLSIFWLVLTCYRVAETSV